MPLKTIETPETIPEVRTYLFGLRDSLAEVPAIHRDYLLEQARARIDLALELEKADAADSGSVARVLERLGTPEELGLRLRSVSPHPPAEYLEGRLASCRACCREVSRDALACPHCGAPHPARQTWRGWGYEWKSPRTLFGLPVVHIAFGRDENGKMRVAKGIIAIGQFGLGAITIAQFGAAAVLGIGQFVVAPIAIGQFALGLAAAGQFGIGLLWGAGQMATGLLARFDMFTWKNWFPGR